MYRFGEQNLEVLPVHPGGPFWAKKDLGAWSVPKGEYDETEQPLEAASREFKEETGFEGRGTILGSRFGYAGRRKDCGGMGFEGDCDPSIRSNLCQMEWPPRSRRQIDSPEIDRAGWFTIADASRRLLPGQAPLLLILTGLWVPQDVKKFRQ